MGNKEFKEVFLNKYGYYELVNPPTVEERRQVFEQEYFQNSMSSYEQSYTEEEQLYFKNKLIQKEMMLKKHFPENKGKFSVLDIGCGEGFALAFFYERGYEVTGIDFSIYGVQHHNPQVADKVIQGDSEEIIPKLIEEGKRYDVINMDSVLDMMINPCHIITLCKKILSEDGVMLIKVANNYSILQKRLLEKQKLTDTHWLDREGHPSYFNRVGLINMMDDYGYECIDSYGESFIDFNLLNDLTNYYEKKDTGKSCYWAKVELENLMHEISPEKTLQVFSLLGEMGLGRELIGIFRQKRD